MTVVVMSFLVASDILFSVMTWASNNVSLSLLRGDTIEQRRIMTSLIEFNDPKTVELKEELSSGRPINILALGGSVTWGALLSDRQDAYPWLIGKAYNTNFGIPCVVDNIAMRATGAHYPSLCLETMIPESATKSYDIILFDFVMNGTDGFPLLLKRLRQRYPDAVVVYVHIWSLVHLARDPITRQKPRSVGFDPTIDWIWSPDTFNPNLNVNGKINCGREICDGAVMEKLVKDAGGYVYKMPLPETPKQAIANGWFAVDWHHLSKRGHENLAEGVLEFLLPLRGDVFKPKTLGSFGVGDQCYNWFQDGNITGISYSGANLKNLIAAQTKNQPDSAKWVLEINSQTNNGSITFESMFGIPVPIGLSYMSKQEGSKYSLVEVSTNDNTPIQIDPNLNHNTVEAHITVYSNIGWANPESNTLAIRTVERRESPFRVVGIFLCGVCAETGDLGTGALNRQVGL